MARERQIVHSTALPTTIHPMDRERKQFEHASSLDWAELENLLADFAKLVKSNEPFSKIARELVERVVESLAAVGAALWMTDDKSVLRLERQTNLEVLGADALTDDHRRLLQEVIDKAQPDVIGPEQGDSHASRYTLLLVPLVIDTEAVGLIEVIQRPTVSHEAIEGSLRFTTLLAELATDYLRRHEIRELRAIQDRSRQFEVFLNNLHATLEPRLIAAELANEGRRHIGCDRVSVALRRGKRYRVVAVSSVDVINRKSVAINRLERLISLVAVTGDEFWHEGGEQEIAPQIEDALTKYLDESHAVSIGVIPLQSVDERKNVGKSVNIGALIVEGFDARRWDPSRETTGSIARHGASALSNALRYSTLPTLPFFRFHHPAYGERTHGMAKLIAVMAVIAAIASTFFIQTDFNLYAKGDLRPTARFHVFAPLDGNISVVAVAHGDVVKVGETLVEMHNSDLDLEMQKLQGEHDAALERSASIESALLDSSSLTDEQLSQINQLSAEQEELRQLFESQQQRLAVLRSQRESLTVRSPIAGEILTWETDEELLDRPVRRGQRLLTVADLKGPWEAELEVPDDQVGPLLKLWDSGQRPIEAKFELATHAGIEHTGEVTRIARRTEINADNQPMVHATIRVDRESLVNPRPGASLNAKIYCGQQSIFYVWCHDLIDEVRGWLRF
jgi:multidrug efflux pump subunit AcrA (membrane-fusion protein)